jgi:hypothetical protein
MALRTTRSSVTFQAPFRLAALDEVLPAGSYEIEAEEEVIERNARTAYVRVATLLYLRTTGMLQIVAIDPQDLRSALEADAAH